MRFLKFFIYSFLLFLSTFSFASEQSSPHVNWEREPILELNLDIRSFKTKEFNGAIKFITDTQGNVLKANVEKSSGNKYVDNAARNSVLRAKMKPYIKNGEAVPISALVPFSTETKFFKEGPKCIWSSESSHYNAQKTYKTEDEALEHLDYIYLDPPYFYRQYETNNPPESEDKIQMGKYDVIFENVGADGSILIINQSTPEDQYSHYAYTATFRSRIKHKKLGWFTSRKKYHDTITLFKQCVL